MSPFVSFEYKGKHYKTEVCNGGGKHPKWTHDEFCLKVESVKDEIKM